MWSLQRHFGRHSRCWRALFGRQDIGHYAWAERWQIHDIKQSINVQKLTEKFNREEGGYQFTNISSSFCRKVFLFVRLRNSFNLIRVLQLSIKASDFLTALFSHLEKTTHLLTCLVILLLTLLCHSLNNVWLRWKVQIWVRDCGQDWEREIWHCFQGQECFIGRNSCCQAC